LDLASYADPHLAAVLIKKYFRDSPDPLFPESLYEVIESCPSIPASAVDPGCRGPEEMAVAEEAELRDQVAKYVREGIFGALGEEERMLFGFVVCECLPNTLLWPILIAGVCCFSFLTQTFYTMFLVWPTRIL
jgi:hypothetical protein